MRSLLLALALAGCGSAAPHPAADPTNAGRPPSYRPLAETAPAPPTSVPLDWRKANDAIRDGGDAAHKR
jgi:hypothetical protein